MKFAPSLGLLALLSMADARPAAAEAAESVTSDTAAYCLRLAARMQDMPDMTPAGHELWAEGRAMCQRGQVRAGLVRLRRAMTIVQTRVAS